MSEPTKVVRVTEERASVMEVSYDVPIPADADDDLEIEDYLDRASMEVHRETLRSNYEITSVEEMST